MSNKIATNIFALKGLPIWVNYNADKESGYYKIPINPKDGKSAATNKPDTWTNYDYAIGKSDHVGFVLSSNVSDNYRIVVIDIDGLDKHTVTNPLQDDIVSMFVGTYAEETPSGKGLHIVFAISNEAFDRYKKGIDNSCYHTKNVSNSLECYVTGATNRYLTFTGNKIGDTDDILLMDDVFWSFMDKYMSKTTVPLKHIGSNKEETLPIVVKDSDTSNITIADIMRVVYSKMESNPKLASLFYDNDPNMYNNDHSRGDLMLCYQLAKALDTYDAAVIDKAFRLSKMYRDKWERKDYSRVTINKAISFIKNNRVPSPNQVDCVMVYDDDHKKYEICRHLCVKAVKYDNIFKFIKSRNAADKIIVYRNGVYKDERKIDFKKRIKSSIISRLDKQEYKYCTAEYVDKIYDELMLEDDVYVDESLINADEDIINFKNGLLNIDTMQLSPHTPEVLCTIQIPADYTNQDTDTPVWDAFITDFTDGNKELEILILQYIGLCISNVYAYRYKKMMLLYGPGDTGKSLLIKFVQQLIGLDNCTAGGLDTLEARFGAGGLYHKRLYASADLSSTKLKELKVFKQAVGGDYITLEEKYKDPITFIYNGVFLFSSNNLPSFSGDLGDHVYNRFIIVPANKVIPVARQDKNLIDKLLAEASCICYKALKQLKPTITAGYKFDIPAICLDYQKKHKYDNNDYEQFIDECFEIVNSECEIIPSAEVHQIMRNWFLYNADVKPKSMQLRAYLENKGVVWHKSNGTRMYKKIRLSEGAKPYQINDND